MFYDKKIDIKIMMAEDDKVYISFNRILSKSHYK